MEDICVIETPSSSLSSSSSSSSNQSCDDTVPGKLFVAKTTSNCMAASTRPCDPRDIKRSRAYQFKSLDQNAFQKITQEKSTVILDRSILTPITDGDQFNDIQMTNSNVECDVIISEEAVIDLTIDDSIDICIPEPTDLVMDVDAVKKGENKTENDRKEDDVVVIVEDNLEDDLTEEREKEEQKEDSKMEVDTEKEKDDKMKLEVPRTEQAESEDNMDTVNKDSNKSSIVNSSTVSEQTEPEDRMDTTNIDSNKLSVANSSAVSKVPMTVSNTRVKNKPFHFNPGPIDDDLISLPSSNELSNQVLSNNFLRDIESLSDLPIGPPFSKVLNKPLTPSCSAFRSSVLSNVTSTGSSLSTFDKQSTKNTVCI